MSQQLNEALQRLTDMASGEHPDLPDAYHTLSKGISQQQATIARLRASMREMARLLEYNRNNIGFVIKRLREDAREEGSDKRKESS